MTISYFLFLITHLTDLPMEQESLMTLPMIRGATSLHCHLLSVIMAILIHILCRVPMQSLHLILLLPMIIVVGRLMNQFPMLHYSQIPYSLVIEIFILL